MEDARTIEVDRSDLHRTRVVAVEPPPLEDGQARLRVERFALTANTVTYAVYGEAMAYWAFFPAASDDAAEGAGATTWGRVPAWGFAEVVESRAEGAPVGERVYGYLPMATELVVQPGWADERGFKDLAEHRQPMAAAYNRYARTTDDPTYRADREDHQMVLWPLFMTSFLIDDLLDAEGGFGAEQVVITSASSKTAFGVAFLQHERGQRVVGLTSPGNVAFTEGLGCYDQVLAYDRVDELDHVPSVLCDVAGNPEVRAGVHRGLGDRLAHSMTVGDTHWDRTDPGGELPGPRPVFFFAPDRITTRVADWGRDGLDQRTAAAWHRFTDWVDDRLTFEHVEGTDAVLAAWQQTLDGQVDPRLGLVCSI